MQLELISREADARTGRPPLLFVHGGFHAAWCWEAHYLDFFAERGWRAHALSLRGHGRSEGRDELARFTLDDYAEDVMATLDGIGGEAVLLGHSMGGAIAERCWARSERVRGLALLAGSPLRPSPSVVLKLFLRSPVALLLGQVFGDSARMRTAMAPLFHSPELPADTRAAYVDRLDLESPLAMRELFSRAPIRRAANDARAALVVAAEHDESIVVRSHEEAAERLGATLLHVPGAHDLMLDPRWRAGADAIEAWLRDRFD